MAAQDIILYRYPHSAWSTRVELHLALRGIKYKQCVRIPSHIYADYVHRTHQAKRYLVDATSDYATP